jgi:surface protein
MDYMFAGAALFNCDISKWDVSNVTGMRKMFNGATSFNQDITKWHFDSDVMTDNMFVGSPLENRVKIKKEIIYE